MAETTHIEWTDATWNPITGCSVVSPGCTNCYAMKLAGTRLKHHPSRAGLTVATKAGPVWTGEVRFNHNWIEQPLGWAKPSRIFVCAHGDLFHEDVPIDWIAWVYGVAIAAVHLRGHVLQILTKRSARAREVLNSGTFWDLANDYASQCVMERVDPLDRRSDDARATLDNYGPENPPPGIWLGVSAEDQERWNERVHDLTETPAAVRWVSAEPLLGRIFADGAIHLIDWLVVGGESGPRPTHPDWIRELRDASAAVGTPFFFKQWGTHAWAERIEGDPTTLTAYRAGKKAAGRLLDGVLHDAMPAVSNV